MRIAEYKQIDVEIINTMVVVDDYNENGEIIGQHEKEVQIEKPIMGMVYRDATQEEIAIAEQAVRNATPPEQTYEDCITELKAQNEMLIECLLEMSELIYA